MHFSDSYFFFHAEAEKSKSTNFQTDFCTYEICEYGSHIFFRDHLIQPENMYYSIADLSGFVPVED